MGKLTLKLYNIIKIVNTARCVVANVQHDGMVLFEKSVIGFVKQLTIAVNNCTLPFSGKTAITEIFVTKHFL